MGEQAIRQGEGNDSRNWVAVLIMSGRQTVKLNHDHPIGTYDVGLDSAATPF